MAAAGGDPRKMKAIREERTEFYHRSFMGHLAGADTALEAGDLEGAANELQQAYDFFPNGSRAVVQNVGGKLIAIGVDEETGQRKGAMPVSRETIGKMLDNFNKKENFQLWSTNKFRDEESDRRAARDEVLERQGDERIGLAEQQLRATMGLRRDAKANATSNKDRARIDKMFDDAARLAEKAWTNDAKLQESGVGFVAFASAVADSVAQGHRTPGFNEHQALTEVTEWVYGGGHTQQPGYGGGASPPATALPEEQGGGSAAALGTSIRNLLGGGSKPAPLSAAQTTKLRGDAEAVLAGGTDEELLQFWNRNQDRIADSSDPDLRSMYNALRNRIQGATARANRARIQRQDEALGQPPTTAIPGMSSPLAQPLPTRGQ